MHDRNKKAMELIAKGWSALKEVDRVIDYCKLNDRRLIPLLRVGLSFGGENQDSLIRSLEGNVVMGFLPFQQVNIGLNAGAGVRIGELAAKENFELALETDNSNTHARYWLSRLHLKYSVPRACKAMRSCLVS
ncbi:hypothetical protein RchiOBHm_Chr2g0088941 [Rosa chinensis]|uniref:Uncharacterized protein n=1 Tax=Rosa chinensis TaxID=74649 RepID=A0A2P6RJ30_ROSCH|nr:hypothetical protein RchiOBHm_Chr2g0088941 [Rosa chinensis]